MKKILIVTQGEVSRNSLEQFYINSLKKLNYDIQVLNIAKSCSKAFRYKFTKKCEVFTNIFSKPFLTIPRNVKIDDVCAVLFFKCDLFWDPVFMGYCNDNNIKTVNVYPDHPFGQQCYSIHLKKAFFSQFQYIFTFSRFLIPVISQYTNANVDYISFGFDAKTHWVSDVTLKAHDKYDVIMFANWGPIQESLIKQLSMFRTKVFGLGWDGRLPDSMYCARTGNGSNMKFRVAETKVTLNLTRAEHGCFSSMKTFELPAMGACVLTNIDPVEMELFTSKEKKFFKSYADLHWQLSDLISNPEKRLRMKQQSHLKVEKYCYDNIVYDLVNRINIF